MAIVEGADFDKIILAHDMSRNLVYAPATAYAALRIEPQARTEFQVRTYRRTSL